MAKLIVMSNSRFSVPISHRGFLTLGLLGLIASLGTGVGEFLVQYTGKDFASEMAFGFFKDVPTSRMAVGQLLIVAFLPLYLFGYGFLYLALRPGSPRLALTLLVMGVFSFVIGGIWVGSRAFLGHLVHLFDDPSLIAHWPEVAQAYGLLLENLVQVLRVLVTGISICFVLAILRGGTLFPRWMALFNPILLLILVFLSYLVAPAVGRIIVPPAMNVAHSLLFVAALASLNSRKVVR